MSEELDDLLLLETGDPEPYPPWNFSWVVDDELAVMAWPQNTLNLDYLYDVGIRHLVTLSPEKTPPMEGYSKIEWTLIPVDEFEDPTTKQILQFIDICQRSQLKNQASLKNFSSN
ncbi:PREDICTED: dual specificity protein phosphatase 23-like [Nicrophorus vespilloides]|uniref:Dual specificity protein phosphatase 23-like n=1 Tax=Nicrophorus vespilloides TaxID=110193 RepID=A0ABM1MUM3_NICVS|nr:PREDICTED: dual specificity protein phosphatase 23-like [Nicrophorus vespilloides]